MYNKLRHKLAYCGLLYLQSLVVLLIIITDCLGIDNQDPLIVLVTSEKFVGDTNQLRGVALAIAPNYKTIEIPADKITKEIINSQKPRIIISSGVYGIEFFQKFTPIPNTLTVHLSHQLLVNHSEILGKIDLIVLPTHVDCTPFSNTLKKTEIFKTIGVCHNVLPKDLKGEYEKYKDSIPISTCYKVIILGGDVQNPDGKTWKYYTTQDVDNLLNILAKAGISKKDCIVILNGPRTGKHNKEGIIDENAHKNGNLDHITRYFVDRLRDLQYHTISLFDFQFGKPSLYKAVLSALLKGKNNTVLVGGDSTSMISEIIDNLGKNNKIYLYSHGAMNKVHDEHLENECKAGRANIITKNGEIQECKKSSMQIIPASTLVAEKILQMLKHAN